MVEVLLDANVLVRHLTAQPRELADRVAELIETAERQRCDLVVAPLTLAEVADVLGSFYKWPKQAVAERLLELVDAEVLVVLEEEAVRQALIWYRDVPQLHFADAYVAAVALRRGHGAVMSFDREIRRLPGITVVEDATQIPTP